MSNSNIPSVEPAQIATANSNCEDVKVGWFDLGCFHNVSWLPVSDWCDSCQEYEISLRTP
jgi:hypothetical protein